MTAASAVVLALGALAPCSRASAADSVGDRRRQLEALRAQIEAKRQEMDAYQKMQDEISRDLSRLRDERESSRRQLAHIEQGRRGAESRKRELTEKLAALTMAEGRGRALLVGEFSGYVRDLQAALPHYGRSELWREAFRREALREKAGYLSRLRHFEAQTSEARARSLARDQELNRRAQAAQEELRVRQQSYQRKEERYREAQEQALRTVQALRDLEDSARALTRLVRTLEKRGGVEPQAGAPTIPKYSLPWPAVGRVVTRFGKERLAKLNSWVIHSGIEIATAAGAAVTAVESGKVIFAGPFRSYGNVLIVDHGRGLYSIYGHLAQFSARKGEAVGAGGPVAVAGSSGQGGLLYFEIRKGAEALDPLQWLKRQ